MKRRRFGAPAAEPNRSTPPNPSKTGCRCLNHKGTPKQQHRTHEAALNAAMARARSGGTWTVYRCPTSERFHVAQTDRRT